MDSIPRVTEVSEQRDSAHQEELIGTTVALEWRELKGPGAGDFGASGLALCFLRLADMEEGAGRGLARLKRT